ncbi:hypothetical protein P154DRAFT_517362, partial [Amniculicola lignicola CBS 123094]
MSLADYLAKNYLNADKPADKKSKKRKRKDKEAGLVIADEDDISGIKSKREDDDDDDGPAIVGDSYGFKKSKGKKVSWKTFGVVAPTNADLNSDRRTADAILASAAADREKDAADDDAAPEMVDTEGVLKMESGAFAGLQTAAQVAAAMKKKQADERKKAADAAKEAGATASETIYRDASGRIINVAKKRAEEVKKAEDAEKAKLELERQARGDVQLAEAAKKREALQGAKHLGVARYADDAELNDELKEKERWGDVALGFTKKKKAGKSVTGKPLYKGSSAPNRYGIRPGHRWDGVDRSNGFEVKWFKAQNRKGHTEKMEYQWQMD